MEKENGKREEETSVTSLVELNHARNKHLLNLMGVPYSGRPEVSTTYVPPTLFQFAHEILTTEPWLEGDYHTLYLGPKTAASERALDALLQANIVGVVNCTTRVPCFHREHFRYCQVPVQDTPAADILIYLEGATTFVDAMLQSGSVLVHCEQGMSRSTAVVMAYLMRFKNMTRDQAYVLCKMKRPMVNPNEGFWRQLNVYDGILKTQILSATTSKATIPTDDGSMKQWAGRSRALFATCREIPRVLQTQDCWRLLEYIQGDSTMIRRLMTTCLDFVWGRGVSNEDIEWLVFVCDQFQQHDVTIQPRDIIRTIVTDIESEFSEAWSGEIDPKDTARIMDALV